MFTSSFNDYSPTSIDSSIMKVWYLKSSNRYKFQAAADFCSSKGLTEYLEIRSIIQLYLHLKFILFLSFCILAQLHDDAEVEEFKRIQGTVEV